jgi:hypothetical protein
MYGSACQHTSVDHERSCNDILERKCKQSRLTVACILTSRPEETAASSDVELKQGTFLCGDNSQNTERRGRARTKVTP